MPRFAIAVTDEDSDLQLEVVEAPDWQTALIECQASPYTAVGPAPEKPDESDYADDESDDYDEAYDLWLNATSENVFLPESVNDLKDDDFNHGHVVRIVEIE